MKVRFQLIQENLAIKSINQLNMGNQEDVNKKIDLNQNVLNWSVSYNKPSSEALVTGLFFNDEAHVSVHYRRFFVDEDKIYCEDGQIIRYLPLFLTSMEQKFYYRDGERIYALKLTNSFKSTILSTYDRENFIKFYCVLAKFCLLNDFDRHFEVKEELGKGSYGKVYRGINRFSRQEVALKVFNKNKLKQNPNFQKVVQNQIYVLGKLKKANLSPLYEVFETPDCIILVLEIAQQGDLVTFLLHDETIVNEKLIKHIFQKILENLSALHAAGFIHRDIKPDNIVVRRGNNQMSLFLCDFSISIVKDDRICRQISLMQAGSRGFVAPEVLTQNIYDEKCDVFSFGCMAYLLLSGKKLFDGLPTQDIIILTEDNDYIKDEISRLKASKTLKRLLQKVLQVDPRKRISSRQALDQEYFSDKQNEKPYVFESDGTLKEFIEKRISTYENSTKGGTTF